MPWLNVPNVTRGYALLVLMMSAGQPSARPVAKLGFVKKLHVLNVVLLGYGSLQALLLSSRPLGLLGRSLRPEPEPFCSFRWHLQPPGVSSGVGLQCGTDLGGLSPAGAVSALGCFC